MQRSEVSGAVRHIYRSLGVKGLTLFDLVGLASPSPPFGASTRVLNAAVGRNRRGQSEYRKIGFLNNFVTF